MVADPDRKIDSLKRRTRLSSTTAKLQAVTEDKGSIVPGGGTPDTERRSKAKKVVDEYTGVTIAKVTKSAARHGKRVDGDGGEDDDGDVSAENDLHRGTVQLSFKLYDTEGNPEPLPELDEIINTHSGTDGELGSAASIPSLFSRSVTLELTLHFASDLLAKDMNGTSDPFVTAYFLENPKETKKKSATKMKTLNPEFNDEVLSWTLTNKDEMLMQTLVVELYDWDRVGKNDFLGMIRFPIEKALHAEQPILAPLKDKRIGRKTFWSAVDVENLEHFDGLDMVKRCHLDQSLWEKRRLAIAKECLDHFSQKVLSLSLKVKAIIAIALLSVLASVMFIIPLILRQMFYTALWYPIAAPFALLWWLPVYAALPRLFGKLMTFMITHLALHGYTLDFGEFHVFAPWIGVDNKLYLRVAAKEMGFGNPPGYPHKYFVQVRHVWLEFAADWATLTGLGNLINTKWSPFPSVNARSTNSGKNIQYVGKVDVMGECDGIMINFEMYNNKFNINELTRLLAEGDIKDFISERDHPNTLLIDIIGARNLVKAGNMAKNAKVEISYRGQTFGTTRSVKGDAPLWNERFEIYAEDPSIVLIIKVKDGSTLLGQWIMTIKWLVINGDRFPFCRYNEVDSSFTNWHEGKVGGWFPLIDGKSANEGKLGEVKMNLQWTYKSETEPIPEKKLTALQQLTVNSDETTFRLGNIKEWMSMMNCFPLLLNVNRLTFREVNFLLEDLFMGHKGVFEAKNKDVTDMKGIFVPRIDVTKPFRTGTSADGLSLWGVFRQFWIHGVSPEVMKHKTKIVGSAIGQIFRAGFYNILHGGMNLNLKDVNIGAGMKKFGNKIRTIGQSNPDRKKTMGEVVNAHDIEALEEISANDVEGLLEKSKSGVKKWELCLCTLKNGSLYYNDFDYEIQKETGIKKKVILATTTQLSLKDGVVKIMTLKNAAYFRFAKDADGNPLILKNKQYPEENGAATAPIERWFEMFQEAAMVPIQLGNVIAVQIQSIGGLKHASQCLIRCTTQYHTDTVAPTKIPLKDLGSSTLDAVVGPTIAEACCVRIDVHKSGKANHKTLLGFCCIPITDISDVALLGSQIVYGPPKHAGEMPTGDQFGSNSGSSSAVQKLPTLGKVLLKVYKIGEESDESGRRSRTTSVGGSLPVSPFESTNPSRAGSGMRRSFATASILSASDNFRQSIVDPTSPAGPYHMKIHKKQSKVNEVDDLDCWGNLEVAVAKCHQMVTVTVLRATDLYPSSKGVGRDVFVTGRLLSDIAGQGAQSTPVAKKTLNPVWDTYMRFPGLIDHTDVMLLRVWSKDSGKNTLIGRVTIPLEDCDEKHNAQVFTICHPQKDSTLDEILESVSTDLKTIKEDRESLAEISLPRRVSSPVTQSKPINTERRLSSPPNLGSRRVDI